jgi:hypothetical protein
LDYGVPPPKYVRRALKMTDGAQEILSFQDLCEDCERVVDKLIKQMKLVTEPKVKERTKSEPLESKEQEEEPAPAPSASTTDF